MNPKLLEMDKDEADVQYKAYRYALQTRKDVTTRDLKAAYGHMRHGRALIDIFDVMPRAGLNKDGDPKLAIVRADVRKVCLLKNRDGSAVYQARAPNGWGWTREYVDDVRLPSGSFKFPINGDPNSNAWQRNEPLRQRCEAPVPTIPVELLPRGHLSGYYILWDVLKWEPIAPKDPFLLKRISKNVFAVLSSWNLTAIERAIIKGHL